MEKDYNSSRPQMIMPEYGRHVHKMVEYIKSLPDKEDRNRMARQLVQIMITINHNLRDAGEFRHKVWDHLAIIANFDLDIDYPVEITKKDALKEKPKKVKYSDNKIRLKHYGKCSELLLAEISKLEDGDKKKAYLEMQANYMKKLYLLWNKDVVSDEQIINDLKEMSGIPDIKLDDIKFHEIREILQRTKKFRKPGRKTNRKE